jgi:hypothetical protein
MKRQWRYVVLLGLLGCGNTVAQVSGGSSEEEELASTVQLLGTRVKEAFGPDAQIRSALGQGSRVVLAVSSEPLPDSSDALPAVALAIFDRTTGALVVLDKEPRYREAALLGDSAAVLLADGELRLRAADGSERVLTQNVRGDLTPSQDGSLLALTLLGAGGNESDTAVAITGLSGELEVVADGDGVDDRPALSPDGRTLVFASGRTGIASLYRTSIGGEAPVQLTNQGIEPGLDRDQGPEGFVPPPVSAARLGWLSPDVIRYDAGGGEYWRVDVRTGVASREGGAR